MYKEVLRRRLPEGKPTRQNVPLEELPRIANKSVASSSEVLVGQDTWSDATRSELKDYDFWIDIDAVTKSDPLAFEGLALSSSYCLAVVKALVTVHHVPQGALRIYFSGRRGFHILLPFRLPQTVPADRFHTVIRGFCQELAASVEPESVAGASIDLSLYGKSHLIRAPWSLHASGLRKVPIGADELSRPLKKVVTLIRQRSEDFKEEMDWEWLFAKESDDRFSKTLFERACAKAANPAALFGDLEAETIRQYVPEARCMAWFADVPVQARTVGFNYPKQFLLSMLRTLGIPKDIALNATKDFAAALSRVKQSPTAKLRERWQEAESAANTVYRSKDQQYDFNPPGRCTSLLIKALGRKDVASTYCASCPKFHRDFRPQGRYRVTLTWLLKQRVTAEAMRTYLELAVNGPAPDMSNLAARTRLTLHKTRIAVKQLVSRKLASVTPAGRNKAVSALRPIQKSISAKI